LALKLPPASKKLLVPASDKQHSKISFLFAPDLSPGQREKKKKKKNNDSARKQTQRS
jgi:hypothetical protein